MKILTFYYRKSYSKSSKTLNVSSNSTDDDVLVCVRKGLRKAPFSKSKFYKQRKMKVSSSDKSPKALEYVRSSISGGTINNVTKMDKRKSSSTFLLLQLVNL